MGIFLETRGILVNSLTGQERRDIVFQISFIFKVEFIKTS